MAFGTSVLLSNGPQASQTTWTLAASGFANPSFLGGDLATAGTGLYTSDGFQIEQGTSLIVAFEGTYGAVTLVHQQTMDLAGATGWFTVVGYALDNSSVNSGASTTGVAYAFAAVGVRHRIQVTALASGTLVARACLSSDIVVVDAQTNIGQINGAAVPIGGGTLTTTSAFVPIGGVNGTSGAGALIARFSNTDGAMFVGGSNASGGADSGFPVKTGGKVNTAVQAFANGNRADTQMTPTGATLVEEGGRSFANITTGTTTTAKSGAGFLKSVTINTYVASATITIFDNTAGSGTKIATITLPATITALAPTTLTYDIAFATGLTLVTSGATDITVAYR